MVLIALIALLALAALAHSLWLQLRVRRILGGANATTLEKQLREHHRKNQQLQKRLANLEAGLATLSTSSSLAAQKISVVRFNPFGDMGSDQSFSLAMLDAHDSGFILTSIHGRGGSRMYLKPIDLGKSKYTLSSEEKKALKQAEKRVPALTKGDAHE